MFSGVGEWLPCSLETHLSGFTLPLVYASDPFSTNPCFYTFPTLPDFLFLSSRAPRAPRLGQPSPPQQQRQLALRSRQPNARSQRAPQYRDKPWQPPHQCQPQPAQPLGLPPVRQAQSWALVHWRHIKGLPTGSLRRLGEAGALGLEGGEGMGMGEGGGGQALEAGARGRTASSLTTEQPSFGSCPPSPPPSQRSAGAALGA